MKFKKILPRTITNIHELLLRYLTVVRVGSCWFVVNNLFLDSSSASLRLCVKSYPEKCYEY